MTIINSRDEFFRRADAYREEHMTKLKLSDGREYRLFLDINALIECEAIYGKPLPQLMADAGAGYVGAARAILFSALKGQHPAINLGDVGAILASDGEAAGAAIAAAVEIAFPSEAKEPAAPIPAVEPAPAE